MANAKEMREQARAQSRTSGEDARSKQPWHKSFRILLLQPGSALQIIIAAVLAIAIGVAVTATISLRDIPTAVPVILAIPGTLWLRALKATVLPLIVTAIILAVQNLKSMTKGGAKLAKWTIFYYISTTIFAIIHSTIMVALVWSKLMVTADADSLATDEKTNKTIGDGGSKQAHDIIASVFSSFIPSNIVGAVANDELLAVLVTACVAGALIKGPNSSLLRAVREVERIITIVITFLIYLAPIGVFFLILSNLMRLDIATVGINLGVLIGASLAGMAIHLVIVLPSIFFVVARQNPYSYWLKCSPSWITAWGSASSAATLPVTITQLRKRRIPDVIVKFTAPLGCLVNMDGTAIYFPVVVIFLGVTQGITPSAGNYVLIVLLSVLSSIATTPIPSSSLVLTVMISGSVGIPVTGMFAVVVAIDWFIDRFRTMLNVSSDLFCARIMERVTGITEDDTAEDQGIDQDALDHAVGVDNVEAIRAEENKREV